MSKNRIVKKDRWKQLLKRVTPLGDYEVHVGVLASQGGNDLHKKSLDETNTKITLLELAAIHEFGSPSAGIPERSFIRRTFQEPEGQKELKGVYEKLARTVITGRMDALRAMEILGMTMQGMVKRRILVMLIPPPNAPSTVAAKGSSRPLVDTGQLVGAISYEIKEKK